MKSLLILAIALVAGQAFAQEKGSRIIQIEVQDQLKGVFSANFDGSINVDMPRLSAGSEGDLPVSAMGLRLGDTEANGICRLLGKNLVVYRPAKFNRTINEHGTVVSISAAGEYAGVSSSDMYLARVTCR